MQSKNNIVFEVLKCFSFISSLTSPTTSLGEEKDKKTGQYITDNSKVKLKDNIENFKITDNEEMLSYLDKNGDYINYTYGMTIGDVNDERPFCRIILLVETDSTGNKIDKYTGDMIVCFRPLNISHLGEYNILSKATKYYIGPSAGTDIDISGKSSADNLFSVIKETNNRKFTDIFLDTNKTDVLNKSGIKLRQGDVNLLGWKYKVKSYINNLEEYETTNIPETIAKFIEKLKIIKSVTFTGFSLGSGMAISSSILTHIMLKKNLKRKTPEIKLYSCCGIPCCNQQAVNYIETNFTEHINTVVKKDYVSYIPSELSEYRWFGPTLALDYDEKDENKQIEIEPSWDEKEDLSVIENDQYSYFSGGCSIIDRLRTIICSNASFKTNFKSYHLSAEGFVPVLLFRYLYQNRKNKDSFFLKVDDASQNKTVCDWLNDNSYAMKYKICDFYSNCKIEAEDNKSKCVYKKVVKRKQPSQTSLVKKQKISP